MPVYIIYVCFNQGTNCRRYIDMTRLQAKLLVMICNNLSGWHLFSQFRSYHILLYFAEDCFTVPEEVSALSVANDPRGSLSAAGDKNKHSFSNVYSWRHQMETLYALLAICAGNSPVTGEFPIQRPVTQGFDVSLICDWINGRVNNREGGDLRRHRAHHDVIEMVFSTRIFNRGVPGFVTDCTRGVWCLPYIGPPFGCEIHLKQ